MKYSGLMLGIVPGLCVKFVIRLFCGQELSPAQKEKLFYLFYMLGDTGKIRSEEKFRYEGEQIYAFKVSPDRFLCFFYRGYRVVVTNAYTKKTDKMPSREKERALKSKADYVKRCQEEDYYD